MVSEMITYLHCWFPDSFCISACGQHVRVILKVEQHVTQNEKIRKVGRDKVVGLAHIQTITGRN